MIGAALTVMSVVVQRLEGEQRLGITGATINLAAVTEITIKGEKELRHGKLPTIEEIL